jgi:putative endonuclease
VSQRQEFGDFGERLAAHRPEASGMQVVARKVRTRGGEIDLIAHDGEDVVFVEVRTRHAGPGLAAQSLTPVKLRRMWQCAMDYCEAAGVEPERARIDVISIDVGARGETAAIEHFRGIDMPSWRSLPRGGSEPSIGTWLNRRSVPRSSTMCRASLRSTTITS